MAYATGTPLAAQLAERGVEEIAMKEVHKAIIDGYGDGAVTAPMQAITIVANPSDEVQ